jgi:RND family efflux transporter MFP subunit
MKKYNVLKSWKMLAYVGAGVLLSVAVVMAFTTQDATVQLQRLKDERVRLDEKIARIEAAAGQEIRGEVVKKPVLVAVQTIEMEQFEHFMAAQGVVESDYNIVLSSKAEGVVESIGVSKGDKVRKGQRLASIDSSLIRANIEEVETSLQLADSIFQRRQRLWDQKIGSEVDYLTAKNNKEALEKKLATLQQQLKNTYVVSPIDGEIDHVFIKEGELAKKNSGVFRVIRLSKLKITVDVSEIYAGRVQTGARVAVEVPGAGIEFESSIAAVSKVIDSKNRTLEFEVNVPNGIEGLKPNMLASVQFRDYSSQALTVPVHVVQMTGEESFVFVADNSEEQTMARRRIVKTGYYNQAKIEVVAGLSAGEMVVTEGFQDLSDGQSMVVQ